MSLMKSALLCAALALAAGCASTDPAQTKSADQVKQRELTQMEKAGQRNDIDKPLQ